MCVLPGLLKELSRCLRCFVDEEYGNDPLCVLSSWVLHSFPSLPYAFCWNPHMRW